jgi:hypothetical protein
MKIPNKIGFHTGPGGNATGIGDWMRAMDAAKIPFMIKSVDSYGPVFEASELAKKSGVPHVLVYRISTVGQRHEYDYDVPPYKDPKYVNDPEGAAVLHWQKTKAKLPREFDKERTWIEPINEVDRNLCDWLGRFAVHIANLANADGGYKVSLFAWSSGEPEPAGWEEPGMLAYLRLCAQRPQQAAIALHEYSYVVDNVMDGFPYKIGRFQFLFDVCDKHGIARPTVHITEWGWTLNDVPPPEKALPNIRQVMKLYAKYPEIKGAAIWYLGPEFGGIANKAQRLIAPIKEFALKEQFDGPDGGSSPTTPPPERRTPDAPRVIADERPIMRTDGQGGEAREHGGQQANGRFVADVNVPDDTRFTAGAKFTKTWHVQNNGAVAWGNGFSLVLVSGDALGSSGKVALPAVQPGQEVDISVQFTAPAAANFYVSEWRLADANGRFFGDLIYTRIITEAVTAATGISNAAYVADITIPDDTQIAAGDHFTKTWRVKNNGTRVWGAGFSLSFVSGEPMTSTHNYTLPVVPPGATADLSLALTAPTQPGTYRGNWRLKDDQGNLFGEFIFLQIVVPAQSGPQPVTPIGTSPVNKETEKIITVLQTGMNINPDAPNSNPLESGELRGLDWVRWVFKLAARHNPAERSDIQAAFRQFDPLVHGYLAQGIRSLIVLNQETVWANAPWSGNNDWQTYANELAKVARQIAARYKQHGDKVGYEIWNEGDLPNNPASVFVPPEQFAKVLKTVAEAIRAESPTSPLVFGGLATGPQSGIAYVQACRQALGGVWPIDAIGIHPYGRWGTKAPFDWANTFGTLGQAFAEYRAANLGLPLWITEIGVAADNEIGPDYYNDIGMYVHDVHSTIAANYAHEAPVIMWFAWSDWMRNAGIVDHNGRRKSAVYAAFERVRNRQF